MHVDVPGLREVTDRRWAVALRADGRLRLDTVFSIINLGLQAAPFILYLLAAPDQAKYKPIEATVTASHPLRIMLPF